VEKYNRAGEDVYNMVHAHFALST